MHNFVGRREWLHNLGRACEIQKTTMIPWRDGGSDTPKLIKRCLGVAVGIDVDVEFGLGAISDVNGDFVVDVDADVVVNVGVGVDVRVGRQFLFAFP